MDDFLGFENITDTPMDHNNIEPTPMEENRGDDLQVKWLEHANGENIDTPISPICVFCLGALFRGKARVATGCGHMFCDLCLRMNLEQGNRFCPTCNTRITLDSTFVLFPSLE